MDTFSNLLEPIKIGTLHLRNRIVFPAISSNFDTNDGYVTEASIHFHANRARGGVGLQIIADLGIDPLGSFPFTARIYNDRYLDGLRRMVNAIHEHGVKCAAQLVHGGRQLASVDIGTQTVAPSPIPCEAIGEVPRELSINEIERLVEAFVDGTVRAKGAGFDAVEFHGAHGYLISQFLSPYSNKRTDRYGGNLEGRMRFALEIIDRSREKVGADFPLIFRMNGHDYVDGGITLKEAKVTAKRLQEAGIDALHISAGNYDAAPGKTITPLFLQKGGLIHLAEAIKQVVDVPIITVGSITPEMAEDILRKGKADLVAMGRALVADPELPMKLAQGRWEDIRRCIRCNDCYASVGALKPMACSLNPRLGEEDEGWIGTTDQPKKVLVIGGGPGGLEAARIAALRGHHVTLYEKETELGGHLREGSVPSFKEDLIPLKAWLSNQLYKSGAKIKIGIEATADFMIKQQFDALILATGSRPYAPSIPGIKNSNVTFATEVLLGKSEVGGSVVVAGGGLVGCETALFLAQQGKQVTIVEILEDILIDMEDISKYSLMGLLADHEVRWLTGTKIAEITDEGVIIVDGDSKKTMIAADDVVLGTGMSPVRDLEEYLRDVAGEIRIVGDAREPRRILNAIHEGYKAAMDL